MSGPERYALTVSVRNDAIKPDERGDYVLFSEYQALRDLHEAVARERDEARIARDKFSLAFAEECVSSQLEFDRASQLSSEVEKLRALLDEAPHEHACSFNICPMCDSRKSVPLHDDVHMKQEYHHAFQNGKCNCWKSRIPRAGG